MARRMREAEDSRQLRWDYRRAQLEHERAEQAEAAMRAYCTVHYTGEAVAEMHSLFDAASSRPSTMGAIPPGATAVGGGALQETVPLAGLLPPPTKPLPPTKQSSSRQRASGAGRVSLLHVGPVQGAQRSPGSEGRAKLSSRGATPGLTRQDTGLRPTTSLPAL